ncbi:phosphoenolpyruvate carboxylase [Flavisolibacter tropicus]|uniref:Phosphoenolpyruvate carboxylase n=1 Tax=Flavisolibacter tropicus TaxID=1492898 RepID=A0A172TQA0_9BACT|nr:phosphoenolpyruvate carboxylase [Flavisolibacter tropicus]ANE49241.1 phosphoenolpyruvate carboxylase [Flavisolibacter tropicus]
MDYPSSRALENFKRQVGLKFQLYNSLFTALPFHRIEKTGVLLALFLNNCEEGYENKQSPTEIVTDFFNRFTSYAGGKEQIDLLFRFVQYVERQVVLFDALEDAAFNEVNDLVGAGTLKQLISKVVQVNNRQTLIARLKNFSVSLVLTAHPTQFYPGSVLGIINDLAKALKDNKTDQVNLYLQQLGKTPLFKHEKPTPYDEAVSLIWYLENVFYKAIGRILAELKMEIAGLNLLESQVVKLGFWPGGDRDGNPNVTVDTSLKVADALRTSIIKCYYQDVRRLRHRLTFKGVESILADLESKLYHHLFIPGSDITLSQQEILQSLQQIRNILVKEHNSLFLFLLDDLINKVEVFGLHFASLDIRQESSVHNTVLEEIAAKENLLPRDYATLNEKEKIELLTSIEGRADISLYEGLTKDTLQSFEVIKAIQATNGPLGCYRYIISQCTSALNVLEVYGLFLCNGWKKEELSADIIPLFETIDDLKRAPQVMRDLYENQAYRQHLQRRKNIQTIMVGFSDGTKDGGYLMANWSIYKAKNELSLVSKEYGIEVIFFDGRGGPPARGGGKTHKYYAAMGQQISSKEIQLTIQGQTISSNFGNVDAAQYNIEQLLDAGVTNVLFADSKMQMLPEQEEVIIELADISYQAYNQLKQHPQFFDYLAEISPLNYFSDTNISSRPSKRGKTSGLTLKDLRAIPFVGAWSQIKQNVPGYFGVGTALQTLDDKGKLEDIKHLYKQSLYFKTLLDNCEMVMKKSYFSLTAYLAGNPVYSNIYDIIWREYELTKKYILLVTERPELMSDYPVEQLSIQMREKIVLPLTTIQQFALTKLREDKEMPAEERSVLERLVVRTSFGIINAGRNSV